MFMSNGGCSSSDNDFLLWGADTRLAGGGMATIRQSLSPER